MTKDEAIALMQSGVKMTHNWFTSDEWVYIGASGQYVLEDGVECSAFEFWKYRTDESWNTDWSRF